MSEKHLEVYRTADLSEYSFKQRILIRLADWTFFLLIKLIGATLKYEAVGMENFDKIADAGKTPIMTFWHNRIFTATHYFEIAASSSLLRRALTANISRGLFKDSVTARCAVRQRAAVSAHWSR